MKRILVSGALMMACGLALALLPPPDDATKAKAAEAAAKSAWQTKVDNYLLCKAQDKVVARYAKTAAVKPVAATAPAAAPAAAAATPPAAAASGTPVAAAPPPGLCSDPGPFAFNPPEQKPLESSGAHSPTGTAASPPSVKPNSAQMAPAQKSK